MLARVDITGNVEWPVDSPFIARARSCKMPRFIDRRPGQETRLAMIETGIIKHTIKDLRDRTGVLRGYL